MIFAIAIYEATHPRDGPDYDHVKDIAQVRTDRDVKEFGSRNYFGPGHKGPQPRIQIWKWHLQAKGCPVVWIGLYDVKSDTIHFRL